MPYTEFVPGQAGHEDWKRVVPVEHTSIRDSAPRNPLGFCHRNADMAPWKRQKAVGRDFAKTGSDLASRTGGVRKTTQRYELVPGEKSHVAMVRRRIRKRMEAWSRGARPRARHTDSPGQPRSRARAAGEERMSSVGLYCESNIGVRWKLDGGHRHGYPDFPAFSLIDT